MGLEEGKIKEEKGIEAQSKKEVGSMKKQRPASLWVAIVALGIIAIVHLGLAITTNPALFFSVVLDTILIGGLVYGQKWAYIVVLVFSALGIAVSLSTGIEQGLAMLVGNAIVVVPMVLSTSFFFPKAHAGSSGGQGT